jgi:predicted Zn-dependent protease
VELDPENASARQRLGIALFHLEKSSEAFDEFAKARELKPDSQHPYIWIGKLLAAEGKNDKARTAFDRAYKEEKTNLLTARAYAEWMIQDGQLNKALEVSAELLKQEPDAVQALLLDSVIAIMSGQTERAEKGLQKVLSLEPNNATATNLLAQLLINQEDQSAQERALSYAQANAKLYPDNGNANITLAWVLFRLRRAQEANAALQLGVRSRNLSLDSTYLIAKILAEQKQSKPAMQALSRTVGKGGLFVYRKEAEELLKKLKAENP